MKATDSPLSKKIDEALVEKLARASQEGRPFTGGVVRATTQGGEVSISVEDADRLGVLTGSVTARRTDGQRGKIGPQAEEAVRRLNYLQEPLVVIEAESRRGRAILRSASPRPTPHGREYNEGVLDGGDSISIRRYRSEPGASKRRLIPSNLSRESLGRLADDLVDILKRD